MSLNVSFPDYFEDNRVFNSKSNKSATFVTYAHAFDNIINVQLGIKKTFLVYILQGKAIFKGTHGTLVVESGEASLIGKGAYIMSETLSLESQQFNAILLFPAEENIIKVCSEFEKEEGLKSLGQHEYQNFCKIETDEMFRILMNSVAELLKMPSQNQMLIEKISELKCQESLYYLLNSPQKKIVYSIFLNKWDDRSLKIRNTVERYYLEDLSLKELAFMSSTSLSSFKREFYKIYNETPRRWITQKRLQRAKELISSSQASISTIANDCGFNNLSYFSSSFKKEYSISPQALRSKNT